MASIKLRMAKFFTDSKIVKKELPTTGCLNTHQAQREFEIFETFHAIKRDVEQMKADYHNQFYYVQVKQFKCSSFEPQAREGAVMIKNPITKKVFLYGGVAHEPL